MVNKSKTPTTKRVRPILNRCQLLCISCVSIGLRTYNGLASPLVVRVLTRLMLCGIANAFDFAGEFFEHLLFDTFFKRNINH